MVKPSAEYTVADHFPQGYENAYKLFEQFSNRVQALDPRIKIDAKKRYIGFKIDARVVIAVRAQRQKITLDLYRVEPSDLEDRRREVKYKTGSFEDFNKHISSFTVKSENDVEYAVSLTQQVLRKFFAD